MRVILLRSFVAFALLAVPLYTIATSAEYHSSLYQHGSGTATSLVQLLPGPHLFIDDYLIESSPNLTRRVNQPQRDPVISNPIITGVDDNNAAPFTTVLRDPDTDRYRIYYNSQDPSFYGFEVSMMESDDGINWERPHLITKPQESGQVGCAVIDEGPDYADLATRFKLGTFKDGGLHIATSPDGLSWTPMSSQPVVDHNHDINNIWYDPIREQYVGIVSSYTTGPTWSGQRRVTMQTVSNDLVNWSDPWYIVTPDDSSDDGETQFYAMQGHLARGDLWIGLVKVLRDDLVAPGVPSGAYGVGYTALAWSRDGVNWVRDQEPFFEPDPDVNAWDHAHAWLDFQLPVGDEIYLYEGGYKSGHKWNRYTERQIGLVRMDLDRYVSRDAGAGGGTLRTTPVLMVGVDGMTVNAQVDGALCARLLDMDGQPISGFDFSDCTPVSGDSLAHTIQWSTPLANLGLTPVRIEFLLQDTQLYGFSLDGPGLPDPPAIETQSFDDEISAFVAGWRGRNHAPTDGLGADLGFRQSSLAGGTPGEAGGTMPGRAEEFIYYADTTLGGRPSQADKLLASGRFSVDSVAPGFDGGFELGFFDADIIVPNAEGAGVGGVQDFLGFRFIDGAGNDSVLRWQARAGSLGSELGIPLEVGQDYWFDLTYDPNGAAPGWGELAIDLRRDSDGSRLGPLTITFPSSGAPLDLNAFGLFGLDFNTSAEGVSVFIDDLEYGSQSAPVQVSTESQNFDDPSAVAAAGWTGHQNKPSDGLGADLDFRTSNHAGGEAGEAGGAMPSRTPGFAYFADTDLGGSLSEDDVLTAHGRFTIDPLNPAFDGGFELGFFNAKDLRRIDAGTGVGGVTDGVVIRLLEQDATSLRWLIRAGDETSYSESTLQAGDDYLFDLLYLPGGLSGKASLFVEFRNADTGTIAGSALLGDLELSDLDLNAFGLISLDFGYINPVANVFIDELTYSVVWSGFLPGDFNSDGNVDVSDLGILATNYGTTSGATWGMGDANGDGAVDVSDLGVLATNYGTGTSAVIDAVPEPGMLVLLSAVTMWFIIDRRRGLV